MAGHDDAQRFCWEQILRTNRLFRISHLFAPPQTSDQLLALHALFASIELLNSEISEELVARKKLDWWRAELLEHDVADSRHPVVLHLCATGALRKLPESSLKLLLDGAESRLDALAPTDEDAFKRLCHEIYHPQVLLELALGGTDQALNSFNPVMLFNGGLTQLLRESSRRKENAFWWIPLSLLARFKVNRTELEVLHFSQVLQALFAHILQLRGQTAHDHVFERQPDLIKGAGSGHLRLMNTLLSRQLDRFQGLSPDLYRRELSRWRIGDVMAAWKRARQLNMKSG